MNDSLTLIEACIAEAIKARSKVSKVKQPQVRTRELRDYLASVAHAWFQSRRPILLARFLPDALGAVDAMYKKILAATDRFTARGTYLTDLKLLAKQLSDLRGTAVTYVPGSPGSQLPPDFTPLAADQAMRDILARRWNECRACIEAKAHLAATVMMGGLLEALFVAKANTLADKSPLFRCKATPIDGKTKKALDLSEWTLAPYIAVGHELGWITQSAKDIAVVLRDYRNYIHPEKERAHGVVLTIHDSAMFWEVTKSLSNQLLA